jgi:hypothetical protein
MKIRGEDSKFLFAIFNDLRIDQIKITMGDEEYN